LGRVAYSDISNLESNDVLNNRKGIHTLRKGLIEESNNLIEESNESD
jgi:hypothetical protein